MSAERRGSHAEPRAPSQRVPVRLRAEASTGGLSGEGGSARTHRILMTLVEIWVGVGRGRYVPPPFTCWCSSPPGSARALSIRRSPIHSLPVPRPYRPPAAPARAPMPCRRHAAPPIPCHDTPAPDAHTGGEPAIFVRRSSRRRGSSVFWGRCVFNTCNCSKKHTRVDSRTTRTNMLCRGAAAPSQRHPGVEQSFTGAIHPWASFRSSLTDADWTRRSASMS